MKTYFNKKIAIEQYRKRKKKHGEVLKKLRKHAPAEQTHIFLLCEFCGIPTQEVDPEISTPKTICDPCKVLHDHGLI